MVIPADMAELAERPPETPAPEGACHDAPTRLMVVRYDEKHYEELSVESVEQCLSLRDAPPVVWIDVDALRDAEAVAKLGEAYGLHPLVLEDILTTTQRPKLEDLGGSLFVVIKMLSYDRETHEIHHEQMSLVIGPTYVLSFQEVKGDAFAPIRERLKRAGARIRRMGADYLAYALIDLIVDGYFDVLEQVGERIEDLEDALVTNSTSETLHAIHHLKRQMIFFRRAAWPLREVIGALGRGESRMIHQETRVYLRDLLDHTFQIMDSVDTFRDMLSGMLDMYLSSLSNRMNEIMKVLTIIATLFIPLTFVTGLYGMNFRYMPELEWRYGYLFVWGIILLVFLAMLAYFRRKRWL